MAAEMERLIEEPTFGPAFSFGARAVPRVFREQWPTFAIMIVMYAVASRYAGDVVVTLTTWAAQFPVIVVVMQMLRRRFRMIFPDLLGLAVASLPAAVAMTVNDSIHPPSLVFDNKLDVAMVLMILLLSTWMGVKLNAASALYALQSDRATVIDALIGSWRRVAGSMWWRLWALSVCIYLICIVPFHVVERLWPNLFERAPTPEIAHMLERGFDLLEFAALLISMVWYQGALMALMSASKAVRLAPVEASPG